MGVARALPDLHLALTHWHVHVPLTGPRCRCPRSACRTLHRLVERQIELGRIVLPEEEEHQACTSGAGAAGGAANDGAVERQMAWLLAAHRGAGHQAEGAPATAAAAAGGQTGQEKAAGGATEAAAAAAAQAGPAAGGEQGEEEEEQDEAALQQSMRDISRALWSTLSSGIASGAVAFPSSRTKADYAYSAETVAQMRSNGELDGRHHRRRDDRSKYMEAQARDATLRRDSVAKPAG